jgi:hypothetical protein
MGTPRIPGLEEREQEGMRIVRRSTEQKQDAEQPSDGELTIDLDTTQLDDDELREWKAKNQPKDT